jgi:perosamine synthetase
MRVEPPMTSTLAILGGAPVLRPEAARFDWPNVDDGLRAAVLAQLDESISIYNRSGVIARLEDRLSGYHGGRRALLTCTGTAALHTLYAAAGLAGHEVICPAYTFFATCTPLFSVGAIPVLADCREDGNLDPADVERRITRNTKAIVVTHMWGLPCDMGPLAEIARRAGLLLLEDGSHAHGATYHGDVVGTLGDAAAFSMQGQKTLTGGEGGFLLISDDELFYRSLLFGQYNNRCKDEIPRHHPLYDYAVTGMGLKLRIHPLAAAIAEYGLDGLDDVLAGRRRMAARLSAALADLPGIEVPHVPEGVCPSWYGYMLHYRSERLGGLSRERFHAAVVAEGCIELDMPGSTRPLNLHPLFQAPGMLFPRYDGQVRYQPGDFPVAERYHATTLKLPVWHRPDDEGVVDLYARAIRKVVEHHHDLL